MRARGKRVLTARPPLWDTSSDGEVAHTRPAELAHLGEHTRLCSAAAGYGVALRCAAGRGLGFVAARLVTTVALVALAVTVALIWL